MHASEMRRNREVQVPTGDGHYYTRHNLVHPSNAIDVTLQVGVDSLERAVQLNLLAHILSEPCFNILRTEEQLGTTLFQFRFRFWGTTQGSSTYPFPFPSPPLLTPPSNSPSLHLPPPLHSTFHLPFTPLVRFETSPELNASLSMQVSLDKHVPHFYRTKPC